jgi:predicted acetyltransferase
MTEEGPRAPKPDEIADLIAHVNLVMREEVGSAPSYALDWPYVITRENLENIRVVLVDDHIVSSTAIVPHETSIGGVNLRIGGINGVSTHPDYRRRGYASRILEACIDHMRDLGCHLSLLSTGVPSWYRKLGWQPWFFGLGFRACYADCRAFRFWLDRSNSYGTGSWRNPIC